MKLRHLYPDSHYSFPLNLTGVIDEEAGEIPRAFVVLRPDQELTASDITA